MDVNYKFYQTPTGHYNVLPGANVAAGSGLSEVSFDAFKQGASSRIQRGGVSLYDQLLSEGGDVARAIRAAEAGGTQKYGVVDDKGNLVSQKALDEEAGYKQKVASGELKEVDMGNGIKGYVPSTGAAKFVQGSVGQNPGQQTVGGQQQSQSGSQTAQNTPQAPIMPETYTVQSGDSINKIAQKLGVDPSVISGFKSGNARLIYPGEKLTITTPKTQTSTVAPLTSNATAQTGQVNATTTPTGKSPTQNVIDTYAQVYRELGISSLKSQWENLVREQEAIQKELGDKIMDISSNPWLSEGQRSKNIQNTQAKYESRLDGAINKAKLLQSIYEQQQEEARFLVGEIQTDARKAIEMAERRAEAEAKLADKSISEIFGTGMIGEYNFAVAQGYKGSFSQYQNEDANRKVSIAKAGVDRNGNPVVKPLSGDAAKVLAIAETIQPEINTLKQRFARDYKATLRGIVFGTDRELVKLVDQIADKIGRLRSGGAVNKDEEARFKRQIASLLDIPFGTADGAIKALDGLLNEARSVANDISPSTTSVAPPKAVDLRTKYNY